MTSFACILCVTIAIALAFNSRRSEAVVMVAATVPFSLPLLIDAYARVCASSGKVPKAVSHFAGAACFLACLISVISFSLGQVTGFFFARIELVVLFMALFMWLSLATVTFCDGKHAISGERRAHERDGAERGRGQTFVLIAVVVAVLLIAVVTSQFGFSPLACRHECNVSAGNMKNNSNNGTLRMMTWNLLLGHTYTGRDNTACVAKVVEKLGADVAGLQESDPLPVMWGSKDVMGSIEAQLSGYRAQDGILPIKSTLGVGVVSQLPVLGHEGKLLGVEKDVQTPHYGYTRTVFDIGLGDRQLHVINVHAVYKNWTIGNLTHLSEEHMQEIARVANLSSGALGNPVVVMGDFNLNPEESQLDWLWAAGLKCGFHGDRKASSHSTLLNRFANVDHIFYKNLKLSKAFVADEIGRISDHYPVVADFQVTGL